MFTETDKNRTRKSEVKSNSLVEWKNILQNEKSYVHVHVPCHAIIEQNVKYKWL